MILRQPYAAWLLLAPACDVLRCDAAAAAAATLHVASYVGLATRTTLLIYDGGGGRRRRPPRGGAG
eukprot:COSAG01_NODE_27915_length_673_cov_13.080139_1_plen_65_part_10